MSLLKRKNRIIESDKHWVNSEAAIIHEHTKYSEMDLFKKSPRILEYLTSPRCILETTRNIKEYLNENIIYLAEPDSPKHDFVSLLKNRRSCKTFSAETMEFQELSNLLAWSAGITKQVTVSNGEVQGESLNFRSYPSGGGLYPCETYVIALNIEGLNEGIYHYNNHQHGLDPVDTEFDIKQLERCMLAETVINDIGCIVVVTSVFERTVTKYGDRGYRLSLLEAGHLMQNILLSATAQNLGSLSWGGFHDNALAKLLKSDVISEPPVHTALIGKRKL
jgi:SagB-type dehydrogenase family enzyme